MQVNDIVLEALSLPASARFEIVSQIMLSLDKPAPEIDRLWGEEAVRRLVAYDAGHSQTHAMDDVLGPE